MRKNSVRIICEGAIFVALAHVLGYVKLWRMPWGGSVTLMMLPVFIFAVRWGWKSGLIAGLALGVLQFLFDGGFVLGWQSIIGDYVFACMLCGLAGFFRSKPSSLFVGSVIGALGRFLSLYVTGATLWAEYMPDTFFGMTMTSPWMYSVLYNIVPVGLSLVLCLIVSVVLFIPLKKYILGKDIAQ